MAQMRRWGKEYKESRVSRGETPLDFDPLDEWGRGLKWANHRKVGAPYRYPEAYMRSLACLHVLFHLPFRQ